MFSISQLESNLVSAIKSKDQITVDTLRGLKVRLQNEKIASRGAGSASGGKDLSDDRIVSLVKSEIKRRFDAAESFTTGARPEMAAKELAEAAILEKYLPAQMSETEVAAAVDEVISGNNFTSTDFGKAMGMLKSKLGNSADGSLIAKLLKEKLK